MDSFNQLPKTNIALAHDSLTQWGGAERVVHTFLKLFPASPLYVVVAQKKHWLTWLGQTELRTTVLQYPFKFIQSFKWLMPFTPLALWLQPKINAQLLLSSSSSFARGFRVKQGIHVNYCHTPTRFVWSDVENALAEVPNFMRPLALLVIRSLRRWDKAQADRIDYFIANSKEVQQRIQKYYNRESKIIYPFIDTKFWKPTGKKGSHFLIAGRLQAHKNAEVVIRAFNAVQLPLHVVGTGRYEKYLQSIAKKNITFLGRVTDEELRNEYSTAQALIYPQLEDFGLMPLEAAACGTPTIGLAAGGSLESVIPGVTGELLPQISENTLVQAIQDFKKINYETSVLTAHAQQFSEERFQHELTEYLEQCLIKQTQS